MLFTCVYAHAHRAMIQSSDDSITLVEFPNRVSWRRDESLSTLNDAVMLDLPVSFTDAAIEQEFDDKSTRSPTVVEMFMKVSDKDKLKRRF